MRTLPFLFALALLAPTVQAAPPEPAFPADLLGLLPGWIAETEAMVTDEDRARPWWNETGSFLQRAKVAQEGGHFRIALFHVETFRELLIGNRLIDEGTALGHESDARALVLQRTQGVKQDAERAWTAYRARLHSFEGELHSLLTIEKALYSADLALTGALGYTEYQPIADAFPKQGGFPHAYVFALVRASYTPLLDLDWADAILDKAVEGTGLPPEIIQEKWTNLTNSSINYGRSGNTPAYLQGIDKLAIPAKENEEGLLSVAFVLAEQRATRANAMQTIFGDASSRGLDVVNDASRNMLKQFNNTTLERPRSYGLTGLFTSDAIDRVILTKEYREAGTADLGIVIVAWSGLEHATYMTNALGSISPIQPPPPTPAATATKGTPAAGIGALVAIAALVALMASRPRA